MDLMVVNPGHSGLGESPLTGIMSGFQKLGSGAAFALGGALVMGVGTMIPGKAGWGFKLLGVAGMGFGAWKIYKSLSGGDAETPEERANREAGSAEEDREAATTGKGSFGMNYAAAMKILADFRSRPSGTLFSDEAAVLKAWVMEVGSRWKDMAEYGEAKTVLAKTGNWGILDGLRAAL